MIINVKVNPKSKRNLVEQEKEDLFRVYVTAAPEDGKANKAMIKLLADYFSVGRSKISIISGEKFRLKVVRVDK